MKTDDPRAKRARLRLPALVEACAKAKAAEQFKHLAPGKFGGRRRDGRPS